MVDHDGFLERKFLSTRGWNSPTLYVLDRRGAELLRTEYNLDDLVWYSSSKELKQEFLEHMLAINDIRIAVNKAAEASGYELLKWVNETELKASYDRVPIRTPSGRAQFVSLIPDSYFILKTPNGYAHFFLELDRGTETLRVFKTKVLAYASYYATGRYEQRFHSKSMRVLTVTGGERRLESWKGATESVGGKRRFWFAVHSHLSQKTI